MSNKKGGIEFGWIFAIIVGAVVLFLAFYFVSTTLLSDRMKSNTIAAQNFDVLMNPLSYLGSLDAVTSMPLNLSEKSELLIECDNGTDTGSNLGWNSITVVTERQKEGERLPRTAYDKYIYADISDTEVKNLHSLTISLKMPWRVADLTMLWPADKTYCFINTSKKIQEIQKRIVDANLNISSIIFTNDSSGLDCDAIVCYGTCNGDIRITDSAVNGLPYSGDDLMLAAIFSNSDLYKCNAVRLAKRLSMQTQIYGTKCGGSISLVPLKTAADDLANNGLTQTRINTLSNAAQSVQGILRC
jgi:hypothetical protein